MPRLTGSKPKTWSFTKSSAKRTWRSRRRRRSVAWLIDASGATEDVGKRIRAVVDSRLDPALAPLSAPHLAAQSA